nr:PREDICTED: uncharacterized protein LOC109033844 [Bemisia tabaci]
MRSQTPGSKVFTDSSGNWRANIQTRLNQIKLPNFQAETSNSYKPQTMLRQTANGLSYSTGKERPLVALNVPRGTYIEREIDKLRQSKGSGKKSLSSGSQGRENILKYKVTVSIPQLPESEDKNSSDRLRVILSIADGRTTHEHLATTNTSLKTQQSKDSKTTETPVSRLSNNLQENTTIWVTNENRFNLAPEKSQKEKKFWLKPKYELYGTGKENELNNTATNYKKSVDSNFRANKNSPLKATGIDFLKDSPRDSEKNHRDQMVAVSVNSQRNSTPQGDVPVNTNLNTSKKPIIKQAKQESQKQERVSGYSPNFSLKMPNLKPQLNGLNKKEKRIKIVNNAFPVIITIKNASNDKFTGRLGNKSKYKDEKDQIFSVPVSVIVDGVPLSDMLKSERLSKYHSENRSLPKMNEKSVEHWNSTIENLETVSDMFNENFTNPCSIVCNSDTCSIMPCLRVLQLMPQVYNSLFQNEPGKTDGPKSQRNSGQKVSNDGNSTLSTSTKNAQIVKKPKVNSASESGEFISESIALKSKARYKEMPDTKKHIKLVQAKEAGTNLNRLNTEDDISKSQARCIGSPALKKTVQLVKTPVACNATEPDELIPARKFLKTETRCKENFIPKRIMDNQTGIQPTGLNTTDTSLMYEPVSIHLPLGNELLTSSRQNIYQPAQKQLKYEISSAKTSPFDTHTSSLNATLFPLQQPANNNFPKVELAIQNTLSDGSNLKQKVQKDMPFNNLQSQNEFNDGTKLSSGSYSLDLQPDDYIEDFDDDVTGPESSSIATDIASTFYPPVWFNSTDRNYNPLMANNLNDEDSSQTLPVKNLLRYSPLDTIQNNGVCAQKASFLFQNNVPFSDRLPLNARLQNIQDKDPLFLGLKDSQGSYSPLPVRTNEQLPLKLDVSNTDKEDISRNGSLLVKNKMFVTPIAPSPDQLKRQKVKVENDVSELILWMPENIPKINFVFKQKNQKSDSEPKSLRRTARSSEHYLDTLNLCNSKQKMRPRDQDDSLQEGALLNNDGKNQRNVVFLTNTQKPVEAKTFPDEGKELMDLTSSLSNEASNDDAQEVPHSHHSSLQHSTFLKNDTKSHKIHRKKLHRHHRKLKKKDMNQTDEPQKKTLSQRGEHIMRSHGWKDVSSSSKNDALKTLPIDLKEDSSKLKTEDKNKTHRHHKKHRKKHLKNHLSILHIKSKNESVPDNKNENTVTNIRPNVISELTEKNVSKGRMLIQYLKHLKSPLSSGKKAQHAGERIETSTARQQTTLIHNEIATKNNLNELNRTMSTARFRENTTFLFDEDEIMNVNDNAFIENDIKSKLRSKTKNKNLLHLPVESSNIEIGMKDTSKKPIRSFLEDRFQKIDEDLTPDSDKKSGNNERSDLENLKTSQFTHNLTEENNFFGRAGSSSANITDDRSEERGMPQISLDAGTNSTQASSTDKGNLESKSGTSQQLMGFMEGSPEGNTFQLNIKTNQTFNNLKEGSDANVIESSFKKKDTQGFASKSIKGGSTNRDKTREQGMESVNHNATHAPRSSTQLVTKVRSKNFSDNFPTESTGNGATNAVSKKHLEINSNINVKPTKNNIFSRLNFFKSLLDLKGNKKSVKNKNYTSKTDQNGRKNMCVHIHSSSPLQLDNTKVYHAIKVPSAIITPYIAEALSSEQKKKMLAHSGHEEILRLTQSNNENAAGQADEKTIQTIEDKNSKETIDRGQKLKDRQVESDSEPWVHEKKERVVQNNLMGSGNFIDAKIYPFLPVKVPDLYTMKLAKGNSENERVSIIPLDMDEQTLAQEKNFQPTEISKFTYKNYNTPFDAATDTYTYPELNIEKEDSSLKMSKGHFSDQLKNYNRQMAEKLSQLGLAESMTVQSILGKKEEQSATLSAAGVSALKQYITHLNEERNKGYIQQLIKSNKELSLEKSLGDLWRPKSKKKFASAHRQLEEVLRKSEKEKDSWKDLKKVYLENLQSQLSGGTTFAPINPSSFEKFSLMGAVDRILNAETESPHIHTTSPEWKSSSARTSTTPTFLLNKVTTVPNLKTPDSRCNRFSNTDTSNFLLPEIKLPAHENFSTNNATSPSKESDESTVNPLSMLEMLLRETTAKKPLLQTDDRFTQLSEGTTQGSILFSQQSFVNISKLLADIQRTAGKPNTESERKTKLPLPPDFLTKQGTEGSKVKETISHPKTKGKTDATKTTLGTEGTAKGIVEPESSSPRILSAPDFKSSIEGRLYGMANVTSIFDKLRQLRMNGTHNDKSETLDQNSGMKQLGKTQDTQTKPENKEKHVENSASVETPYLSDENMLKKVKSLLKDFSDMKQTASSKCDENSTEFKHMEATELPLMKSDEMHDRLMRNKSFTTDSHRINEQGKATANAFETSIFEGTDSSCNKAFTITPRKQTRFTAATTEESGSILTTKKVDGFHDHTDGKHSNQKDCETSSMNTVPKIDSLKGKQIIQTDVTAGSIKSKEAWVETEKSVTVIVTTEGAPSTSASTDKVQHGTQITHEFKFSPSSTLFPSKIKAMTKNANLTNEYQVVTILEEKKSDVKNQKVHNNSETTISVSDRNLQFRVTSNIFNSTSSTSNPENSTANLDHHTSPISGETKREKIIPTKTFHAEPTEGNSMAKKVLNKSEFGNLTRKTVSNRKISSVNPTSFRNTKNNANNPLTVFRGVYKTTDEFGSSTMKAGLSKKLVTVTTRVRQTSPGTKIKLSTVEYNLGKINVTIDENEKRKNCDQGGTFTPHFKFITMMGKGDYTEMNTQHLTLDRDQRIKATESTLPSSKTQCVATEIKNTTAETDSCSANKTELKDLTTLARKLNGTEIPWKEKKIQRLVKHTENRPTGPSPLQQMSSTTVGDAASKITMSAIENEMHKSTINLVSASCDCKSATEMPQETQIQEDC